MEQKTKEMRKPERSKTPYHFTGGTEYVPVTIEAETYEEAEAEWLKTRVKQPVNITSDNDNTN